MELSGFVTKFANLFEETDPASITPDTVYSQLEEWDSVMVLLLVSMVDEEYGITIPGTEISLKNFSNVDGIVALIEKFK